MVVQSQCFFSAISQLLKKVLRRNFSPLSSRNDRRRTFVFLPNTDLSVLSANSALLLWTFRTHPTRSITCCFCIYEKQSSDLRDANNMLIYICRGKLESHAAIKPPSPGKMLLEEDLCGGNLALDGGGGGSGGYRFSICELKMCERTFSSMDSVSAWLCESLITFSAAPPLPKIPCHRIIYRLTLHKMNSWEPFRKKTVPAEKRRSR